MSKKKNKRSNKSVKQQELQYSSAEILVPMLVLLAFVLIRCWIVVNTVIPLFKTNEIDNGISESDIWEQTYLEVERNRVGIIFDPISTSEEEYTQLRIKCNEFVDFEKEGKHLDADIAVDIAIDEDQFVDGETTVKTEEKPVETNTESMAETGPIYFQDMLILRYINETGALKVITGMFNETKESIEVVRQENIAESILNMGGNISSKGLAELHDESNVAIEDINMAEDKISESDYLLNLSETLELMLTASSRDEVNQAESMALNYFTLEGKQTVFGNRDQLKIKKDTSIDTILIRAGKSDLSKTYKDRIYSQLKVTVGGESTTVNIILKLNSNLRV